jgi:uncharacterized protein (TIGR00290 family)
MKKRALLAWSSGKDGAWALHELRADPGWEVAGLFTTVYEGRIPVHGTPLALLRDQAAALDLPLEEIEIPWPCPNEVYEQRLGGFARRARADGISALAFGDLFLEDIRRYREAQFAGTGLELLFPLWSRPTRALADRMVRAGLRAWVVAVDLRVAPRDWAGRVYDEAFVESIGERVDPCGENGEFHTFVFDGPMFGRPVRAAPGPVTERDGFACVDLVSSAPC